MKCFSGCFVLTFPQKNKIIQKPVAVKKKNLESEQKRRCFTYRLITTISDCVFLINSREDADSSALSSVVSLISIRLKTALIWCMSSQLPHEVRLPVIPVRRDGTQQLNVVHRSPPSQALAHSNVEIKDYAIPLRGQRAPAFDLHHVWRTQLFHPNNSWNDFHVIPDFFVFSYKIKHGGKPSRDTEHSGFVPKSLTL